MSKFLKQSYIQRVLNGGMTCSYNKSCNNDKKEAFPIGKASIILFVELFLMPGFSFSVFYMPKISGTVSSEN